MLSVTKNNKFFFFVQQLKTDKQTIWILLLSFITKEKLIIKLKLKLLYSCIYYLCNYWKCTDEKKTNKQKYCKGVFKFNFIKVCLNISLVLQPFKFCKILF